MWVRKRKKTILIASGIGVIAAITLLTLGYCYCRANIRRYYEIAPYVNALEYYQEKNGTFPRSVEEVEDAYNSYERRRVAVLPSDPDRPRPIFRPVECRARGPFLVMIEPGPVAWHSWFDRYVIYACGDGPCPDEPAARAKRIWVWNLVDALAEDDRNRKAACSAHGER